jgi:hypothetical protein
MPDLEIHNILTHGICKYIWGSLKMQKNYFLNSSLKGLSPVFILTLR